MSIGTGFCYRHIVCRVLCFFLFVREFFNHDISLSSDDVALLGKRCVDVCFRFQLWSEAYKKFRTNPYFNSEGDVGKAPQFVRYPPRSTSEVHVVIKSGKAYALLRGRFEVAIKLPVKVIFWCFCNLYFQMRYVVQVGLGHVISVRKSEQFMYLSLTEISIEFTSSSIFLLTTIGLNAVFCAHVSPLNVLALLAYYAP